MSIYDTCSVLENELFKVQLINISDADDLLKVYSDKSALPFFNSDNCNGSNFYCAIKEHIEGAIKYWLWEYTDNKAFVRLSIIDKKTNEAIGTIEMFKRTSDDCYNGLGLMRIDLRSDYENTNTINNILSIVTVPFYELFECSGIITKAPGYAIDRIEALTNNGYVLSDEPLVGQSPKRLYYDYWRIDKEN